MLSGHLPCCCYRRIVAKHLTFFTKLYKLVGKIFLPNEKFLPGTVNIDGCRHAKHSAAEIGFHFVLPLFDEFFVILRGTIRYSLVSAGLAPLSPMCQRRNPGLSPPRRRLDSDAPPPKKVGLSAVTYFPQELRRPPWGAVSSGPCLAFVQRIQLGKIDCGANHREDNMQ